jgi:hypothetical protein
VMMYMCVIMISDQLDFFQLHKWTLCVSLNICVFLRGGNSNLLPYFKQLLHLCNNVSFRCVFYSITILKLHF